METEQVIDQVSQHLSRYEALARMATENTDPEDLILLLSDLNQAFRSTLDRLAT